MAAQNTPIDEEIIKLFVEGLGWQVRPVQGLIATHNGIGAVWLQGPPSELPHDVIGVSVNRELYWKMSGVLRRLPLMGRSIPPSLLQRWNDCSASANPTADRLRFHLGKLFDPNLLATDLAAVIKDFLEFGKTHVYVQKASQRSSVLASQEYDTLQVVATTLTRIIALWIVQSSQTMSIHGRTDYLSALYCDWQQNGGPYRLGQRLNLLFFCALGQPSRMARKLLAPQIGQVDCLGSGLFQPTAEEVGTGLDDGLFLGDEALSTVFSQNGMLNRFVAELQVPGRIHDSVSVNAATLSTAIDKAFDSFSQHEMTDNTLSRTIDMLVDTHAWYGRLMCQALESLKKDNPDVNVPDLVSKRLRGYEADAFAVLWARLRLGVWSWHLAGGPITLPDLRDVIVHARVTTQVQRQLTWVETSQQEFKSRFEWNSRTGQVDPQLRFGVLKTIAGFLNSQGGVLWIGVQDDGNIIGIENELARIEELSPLEVFENKIRQAIQNQIEPLPLDSVSVEFVHKDGKQLCKISVKPRIGVSYLHEPKNGGSHELVCVRDGARTISLTGKARDQFIISRSEFLA